MKTWDDLSDDQKNFIRKHLKKGFKDIFRKREKSSTNQAIISAFLDYEALEALYLEKSSAVPDDYPQRGPIVNLHMTARTQKNNGNFETACETLRPAIRQMEVLREDLIDAADTLRGQIGPIPAVELADADVQAMADARKRVMDSLADELPTAAQMTQARADYVTYQAAIRTGVINAKDIPAATLLLDQARARAQTLIDATTGVTPSDYSGTPQAAAIEAAVQRANDLTAALGIVDKKDSVSLRALAAEFNSFADADAITTLVPDAKNALKSASDAKYLPVRAKIEAERTADLSKFSGAAEYAQMTGLQDALTEDVTAIEVPMVTINRTEIDLRDARILAASNRADTLAQLRETVGLKLLKEQLTNNGAQEAHQNGILELMKTNPAAADKVIKTLEKNAARLDNMDISTDALRTKTKEVNTLIGEAADIKKDEDDAAARQEQHRADWEQFTQEKTDLEGKVLAGTATPDEQARLLTVQADIDKEASDYFVEKGNREAKEVERLAKENELAKAKDAVKAAAIQRNMLDAITYGPLSPDATNPIPDDLVEDVVTLFDTNPALANQTCRLAAFAKDPKSMAETAVFLAGKTDTGFAWQPPAGGGGVVPDPKTMDDKASARYARDILARSAYFGADYAAEAQAAITNGVQFQFNDKMRAECPGAPGGYSAKNVAKVRATEAAETMMTTVTDPNTGAKSVKLDLDSPAFNAVLTRQKFSQDGQFQSSPMLNEEMDKLKDFFTDPTEGANRVAQAETILNGITAVPASPAARKLLAQSMNIPDADFDDPAKADEIKAKVQQAVLKAMVTPVSQGNVGSCFATAPVRNLRDEDPLEVMRMYTEIATTGVFTPKSGRPMPAVTNIQPDDDALTRSLEYSVATAGARLNSSREHKTVDSAMITGGMTGLDAAVSADGFKKLRTELPKALANGYTFLYDPLAIDASGTANDGSSDRGFIRMVEVGTSPPTQILSEADFVDYVKRKAQEVAAAVALDAADLLALQGHINDPSFITRVAAMAGKSKPWAMPSGGFDDEAGDALMGKGGYKRATDLVSSDASDSAHDRALKVLESLGGLNGGNMTMVATTGMHAFNALPPEGEYKKLMTGDVADNIDKMLVQPGQKIATEKMPKDKAIHLFDKQLEAFLSNLSDPALAALIDTAFAARPTVDMTPGELEQHISATLDPIRTAQVNKEAADWAAAETTPPSPADLAKKKTDLTAAKKKGDTDSMRERLAQELAVPEFVVADSNWGNESNHYLFVIAPDPLTGEACMWQKSVIGGRMVRMDDKWLNAGWELSE